MNLTPCSQPTFVFLGVSTAHSSSQRMFPRWAERLGLGPCQLRGIDLPLHAPAAQYRELVQFIKNDPLALGALITSHKMDLGAACRDQFDFIDPLSASLGEISCIYKRDGKLLGRAVDPFTVGPSLEAFLPPSHWLTTQADVLILGAGGSAISLAWYLCQGEHGLNRPSRIIVANRSQPRLAHLKELHASWKSNVALECQLVEKPELADALTGELPPGSMVVNATGLGKDAPGSPLTNAATFPKNGYAWEFNYRGDLLFLQQARRQQDSAGLTIEDGWVFFLHGWSRVVADVFGIEIPPQGPLFDDLARIAAGTR